MKKDFLRKSIFLLLFTVILFGCSNEEQNNIENVENVQLLQRNSGEIYEGFEDLFNEIYDGNFQVGTSKTYESNFLVTEISVNSIVKGYFVEDTRNNSIIYFNHNDLNGSLDKYTIENEILIKNTYDLTKDSEYAENGFSPDNTQLARRRPFWGYGDPYLSEDCINGRRYWYERHYAFWIGFSEPQPVYGSDGSHMWAPCE